MPADDDVTSTRDGAPALGSESVSVDAAADRLREFGLSEKEVDVYLTVLRHGDATAKTLADEADLSTRYVYDVAESLESRGVVTLNDHATPTTIRAVPPTDAVSELVRDLRSIEDVLGDLYQATEPQSTEFDVLGSRRTLVRRVHELVRNAEEEVTLMGPPSLVATVADDLADARDRGVFVLLVATGGRPPDAELDRSLDAVANATRVLPDDAAPFMLTADVTAGIVSVGDVRASRSNEAVAVSVVQEQLVATVVGSFLGNYWERGEQERVATPASFPVTHEHFRHAVFDAASALADDVAVRARITERGAPGTSSVTGEVVHVRQGLVEPSTNDFPIEHSLVLDDDDDRVTVGGRDSFLETYEATEVRLERIEDR